MESTLTLSPGNVNMRLPSLDNLLESEVIIGDGDSSCDDDSEMHSAVEDLMDGSIADNELSQSFTKETNYETNEVLTTSTRLDTERIEATFSVIDTALLVPEAKADVADLSSLVVESAVVESLSDKKPTCIDSSVSDCHITSVTEMTPPELVKQAGVPTPPVTPRSSSTASSRGQQSLRSSPSTKTTPTCKRQPSYAESTTSSKNRCNYSYSPFLSRRSLTAAPAPTQQAVVTARKPPLATPPRPKSTSLVRQTSNLKPKVPESPMSPRRNNMKEAASPAKSFIAAGKQPSILRQKPVTLPKRDDKFATLGRKTKVVLPTSPPTENTQITKDTKAAADKFATLPRRKAKERTPLPKMSESFNAKIESSPCATLPRSPKARAAIQSPTTATTKCQQPSKQKTIIYMEKCAQTELLQEDIQDGQEAVLRLRSLSRQQQQEENRDLEKQLEEAREEILSLQQELDEERVERRVVQEELERTTLRVAAMLDSMEGVEREFHSRGDSLVQLENSLQTSTHAVFALQEQLEAQDTALLAQRLELDRSLAAQKTLLQQLQECEGESREMVEFLQAEKAALNDAIRDLESDIGLFKSQIVDLQQQLQQKEEECLHLVRLAEQRRHEIAAIQAEMKGAEGRTGTVLLAQGAQLSAAAVALVRLSSRLDGLLHKLLNSHSLPAAELEAVVFNNEAYTSMEDDSEPLPSGDILGIFPNNSTPPPIHYESDHSTSTDHSPGKECNQEQQLHPLVGSASLQDLSDAINLSRRGPPEGQEEPNPIKDNNCHLTVSLADQIEEADHSLSKLLRVLRRMLLDKDTMVQQLSDEKEQLQATLNVQINALQETRDELNKLRKNDDDKQELQVQLQQLQYNLEKADREIEFFKEIQSVPDNDTYYNKRQSWNDSSTKDNLTLTVSQILNDLPVELLQAHPTLLHLQQQLQVIYSSGSDPNANGTG